MRRTAHSLPSSSYLSMPPYTTYYTISSLCLLPYSYTTNPSSLPSLSLLPSVHYDSRSLILLVHLHWPSPSMSSLLLARSLPTTGHKHVGELYCVRTTSPSLSLLTRMDVSGRSWLGVSTSALGLLSIPVVTTLSSALGSTVHPVYLVYLLLATASITSSLLSESTGLDQQSSDSASYYWLLACEVIAFCSVSTYLCTLLATPFTALGSTLTHSLTCLLAYGSLLLLLLVTLTSELSVRHTATSTNSSKLPSYSRGSYVTADHRLSRWVHQLASSSLDSSVTYTLPARIDSNFSYFVAVKVGSTRYLLSLSDGQLSLLPESWHGTDWLLLHSTHAVSDTPAELVDLITCQVPNSPYYASKGSKRCFPESLYTEVYVSVVPMD